MSSWDKYLQYEEWLKKFETEIKALAVEKEYYALKGLNRSRARLQLAYSSILLCQLVNGSRISEAVQAVMQFATDKKREQYVAAKKRRAHKKDRLVIIPRVVRAAYLDVLKNKTERQIINSVVHFAHNHWHINTHSLRYSFVSFQNRNKTPATVTAGILRHTNVNMIEKYGRDAEADDFFKRMVKSTS